MFGLFKNKKKFKTLIIEDIKDLNLNFLNDDSKKTEYYQYTSSSNIKELVKNNRLTLSPKKDIHNSNTIFNFNNIEIDTVIIRNSKNIMIPSFFCKYVKNIEIENSNVIITGFRAKHIDFKMKESTLTIHNMLARSAYFSAKDICKLTLHQGAVEHLNIENRDYIELENGKNFYAKILTTNSLEHGLFLGSVNVVNTLCVDELKNGDLTVNGRPTIQYKQNSPTYYTIIDDFNCSRFKSNNKIKILDDIVNDINYNKTNKPSFLIEEEKRLLKDFSRWELQEYSSLLKQFPEYKHEEYTKENYNALFQKTIEKNIQHIKKQVKQDPLLKDMNKTVENKFEEITSFVKLEEENTIKRMEEERAELMLVQHVKNETTVNNSDSLYLDYLKILNHEFPTDFINEKNRNKFIDFLGNININQLNEVQALNAQSLKAIYKVNQNSTFNF